MNELLDINILEVIRSMGGSIRAFSGTFVNLSLQISSLLLLFVIAREGFNLMLGKKSFDPIWWIRPILMVIIIGGWNASSIGRVQQSLPLAVNAVFGGFENGAKSRFTKHLSVLDNLKKKKSDALAAKHKEISELRAKMAAAKRAAESEEEKSALNPSEWIKSIKSSFEDAKEYFRNYIEVWTMDISNLVDKVFEFIGNFIWRVALYTTLTIKELSLAFLFIFGPISFALSVYDTWSDAWAQWLMRYISFQFYGFVAYTIMTGSLMIISYGIQNDIKVLSQPGFPEAFSFSAMYTLFGYLVGAFALKIVPEVVSWIVPTNASQAATQFTSGMSGAITGAAAGAAMKAGKLATSATVSSASAGTKATYKLAKATGSGIKRLLGHRGGSSGEGSQSPIGAPSPSSGSSTKK